ncbi:MAG: MFS transporter [Dysosmobacter sp.]
MTKACQPSLQRVNFTYTLVQLIYWSLFAAFAGYQTALLLGRGFTSGQAGVFAAIRCLSGIVAQPLLGGWADRHRAIPLKWILNVCFALALAVNAVFYFTRPGFWGTAAIFVALGALELNAYPLLDSMAVQFINAGMEVNYSLGRGLGSFAYAVSCVVLGRQSAAFGVESVLWTHAALLVLLMAVVACCPTAPVVSHASAPQTEPPHSVWQILRASPSFS